MRIHAASTLAIAVMDNNRHLIFAEPDVELNGIDAKIHGSFKGDQRVFGIFRSVASVAFYKNIAHDMPS